MKITDKKGTTKYSNSEFGFDPKTERNVKIAFALNKILLVLGGFYIMLLLNFVLIVEYLGKLDQMQWLKMRNLGVLLILPGIFFNVVVVKLKYKIHRPLWGWLSTIGWCMELLFIVTSYWIAYFILLVIR